MGENRYMICGTVECFVTFNGDSEMCIVRLGESYFDIPVELLKIIASPAP